MTGGFFLVDFDMILFLMFMGFIAAFIVAIVGGGGLIIPNGIRCGNVDW